MALGPRESMLTGAIDLGGLRGVSQSGTLQGHSAFLEEMEQKPPKNY